MAECREGEVWRHGGGGGNDAGWDVGVSTRYVGAMPSQNTLWFLCAVFENSCGGPNQTAAVDSRLRYLEIASPPLVDCTSASALPHARRIRTCMGRGEPRERQSSRFLVLASLLPRSLCALLYLAARFVAFPNALPVYPFRRTLISVCPSPIPPPPLLPCRASWAAHSLTRRRCGKSTSTASP